MSKIERIIEISVKIKELENELIELKKYLKILVEKNNNNKNKSNNISTSERHMKSRDFIFMAMSDPEIKSKEDLYKLYLKVVNHNCTYSYFLSSFSSWLRTCQNSQNMKDAHEFFVNLPGKQEVKRITFHKIIEETNNFDQLIDKIMYTFNHTYEEASRLSYYHLRKYYPEKHRKYIKIKN